MAVELLSENVELLHGKWNKIVGEKQSLEKYHSMLLAEILKKAIVSIRFL